MQQCFYLCLKYLIFFFSTPTISTIIKYDPNSELNLQKIPNLIETIKNLHKTNDGTKMEAINVKKLPDLLRAVQELEQRRTDTKYTPQRRNRELPYYQPIQRKFRYNRSGLPTKIQSIKNYRKYRSLHTKYYLPQNRNVPQFQPSQQWNLPPQNYLNNNYLDNYLKPQFGQYFSQQNTNFNILNDISHHNPALSFGFDNFGLFKNYLETRFKYIPEPKEISNDLNLPTSYIYPKYPEIYAQYNYRHNFGEGELEPWHEESFKNQTRLNSLFPPYPDSDMAYSEHRTVAKGLDKFKYQPILTDDKFESRLDGDKNSTVKEYTNTTTQPLTTTN